LKNKSKKDLLNNYLLSDNPNIFEPDMKLINEYIYTKAMVLDLIIN